MASDRQDSTIGLRMRHIRDLASRFDLMTVTADDLHEVLAARRELSPETRKSQLASWRVFFGWAHKRGMRADDPTGEIRTIRVPVRVPRIAPDDEIQRAIERANPQHRAMILLARYACLRLTEVTRLHTDDRAGDMLRILGKGDKERMVCANEPLLLALRRLELAQGRGYYFPGLTREHMHPMSVNKIITRVTGWNPHSLRHAGATAAYNATGDLRGVQEMLGHASLATTQRYLHLDAASRRRLAAATVIPRRDRLAA
ncbi:tyrosine-type recombinase/integrase [Microbacterium sp. dk485]|uniref:tyrosine-type recombinase/integrase n=1 Tax=Microbacterium sp. dk485 TaxID=2560021 RepID=UPI001ADD8ACE|nr:tyrosine-type recombinase/integrase [Microbacterium sp. dk485]